MVQVPGRRRENNCIVRAVSTACVISEFMAEISSRMAEMESLAALGAEKEEVPRGGDRDPFVKDSGPGKTPRDSWPIVRAVSIPIRILEFPSRMVALPLQTFSRTMALPLQTFSRTVALPSRTRRFRGRWRYLRGRSRGR